MQKVMTVTGPIDPRALGITLMHEHLFADFRDNFVEAEEASVRAYRNRPVSIEILPMLRQRPFSVSLDNAVLGDERLIAEEVSYFKAEGGLALVDVTPIGVGRDPLALQRLSRVTGVSVVMGGGLYIEGMHPSWVSDASVEDIADRFVAEATTGVGDTGVRTGIIGELGTSGIARGETDQAGPITAEEKRVLQAAGQAAVRTGLALSVHLDPRTEGAFPVFEILTAEGVPPDRIVMGHMDMRHDLDYHRAVAELGVYVAFDGFGREGYTKEWGDRAFGHDSWRVSAIAELVEAGHVGRLVVAQDIALKMDLRKFGGVGYGHVLAAAVPMLRRAGVSEDAITTILVDNPREILTVDWDSDLLEGLERDVRQMSGTRAGG